MNVVLAACLSLAVSASVSAQVPRDNPPPSVVNAQRERELKAAINAGTATRDTYLELMRLLNRQQRRLEAADALRGVTTLDPEAAEPHLAVAVFIWDVLRNDTSLDATTRRSLVKQALADVDRALTLKPDYPAAADYKKLLTGALQDNPSAFAGFAEPFEQSLARLTPIRIGGNVKAPVKVRDVKPVYPPDAMTARVQGVVIIETIVGPDGSVENARVLRPVPMLSDAALAAVSQWRFTPTEVNGVATAVILTVTVNFTLSR